MQQKFKINGITIVQPDEDGYSPSYATTSSSDSGRTLRGVMKNTPLFTTEAYQLKWSNIKAADAAIILQQIKERNFDFYHFNMFTAKWETAVFYASNFKPSPICLKEGEEILSELSFQVTGVNPV